MARSVDFRVLGPLEVLDDGRDFAPRRAKQRALLAIFLLHGNEHLASDRLIDAIWGEEPPDTAGTALHGHVSALRKVLGPTRIRTEPGGYRFELKPGELDLDRFESALAAARTLAEPRERAKQFAEALASWRGDTLADLRYEGFDQPEIARVDELRLSALEERIEADLAVGRHVDVLPELEGLVAEHPMRERFRGQQMLALYRSGRQAEALRAYESARRVLAEELGIDPGPALQRLEQQILAQDADLLPAPVPTPAGPRQERKLVTVLVVEIVAAGPTDPEDLDRRAGPALGLARTVVERYGGTTERLFANAVLAVFGAPKAHDDDAERAVRAALDLLADATDGRLQLRIGIETGEALVTITGTAVEVTGDVLASASHLQSTTPGGTISVGDATYRATADIVAYEEAAPGSWRAQALRAGGNAPTAEAPFIGREDELALLRRTFARARNEHSVQLVTVTAEPGGGKSRLVRELRSALDATGEPYAWRQGRCLPYGEGVTYWALGEIVKAQAGILESDDSETSGAKLELAVAAVEPDAMRRVWVEQSLKALIGIEGATASGDREQAFAVWRQFLEGIAASEPLVVVFEDIHWADDALLELVDHLARRASGVPIVILCTARLELLTAHPDWGGGKRNSATLALGPLSDAATEELLRALLGRPPGRATIRRAGGNPLFARELALIVDRLGSEDVTAIPDSLQAVISARLDALSPELKGLAHDAAVVGEVFWTGALASMTGLDNESVEDRLDGLVANDVARRHRSSSVATQAEFSFMHVLVRDVAYGQIPRRARVAKHRAAAEWIERLAGDRLTDHAELVAHHYVQGLELARGLGDDEQARELELHARRFLALAGERMQPLDSARSETFFRRALEMTPSGDPARGRLLSRLGDVAQYTGRLPEAEGLCRAAVADLQVHGDLLGAGDAMVTLAVAMWRLGRPEEQRRTIIAEAIAVLEQLPPGTELVKAYSRMAIEDLQAGYAESCRAWSLKALTLADELGLDAAKSRPLQHLGYARFEQGDLGGLDDMRSSLQIGLETGLGWETATAYANLAEPLWLVEGPASAVELKRTAAEFSDSHGLTFFATYVRAEMLWFLFDLGRWDELITSADEAIRWDREHGRSQLSMIALTIKARVLACRGRVAEAAELETAYLPHALEIGVPQAVVPALASAAAVRYASGDVTGALALIAELEASTRGRAPWRRAQELAVAGRLCAAMGAGELARALLPSDRDPVYLRGTLSAAAARAALAEADGAIDEARQLYATAAVGWHDFGCPPERAFALLGEARCLVAAGRLDEAGPVAGEARRIATELGAIPLVTEADRLLAAVAA